MGLKASIPGVQATFHQLHYIRHLDAFAAGSIHLKKPPGGRKGLIGPPCHLKDWGTVRANDQKLLEASSPGFLMKKTGTSEIFFLIFC
jgi:hypothetical protein